MFCFVIKNFKELVGNTIEKYMEGREIVLYILEEVLKKVNGYNVIKERVKRINDAIMINGRKIDLFDYKRIFLIGFGKASAEMAKAMEEIVEFDDSAIITTRKVKTRRAKVYIGTHPYPSQENIDITEKILEIVKKADKDDLIFCLISGGGSSLLCKPRVSLEALIDVTEELMKKGCGIEELNTVRKHLSCVKGGQLAKMSKAKIISLIISDIIGNPVEFISSGPTAEDTTTFEDALKILKKYGVKNKEVLEVIKRGIKGEIDETPKKLSNVENFVIADIGLACNEAKKVAEEFGIKARIIKTDLRGEAKEVGKDLAKYARYYPRDNAILIFGGETTVKVKGDGKGGRNQEMMLSAIEEIKNEHIVMLSCGTDGIDGNSPAAGAIIDGYSYEKAKRKSLNINEYLERNDSYTFFEKMGDAIMTGYTGTNVMDIQIIYKL